MKKVLWIDLETTGTNPAIHGIIQLAAIVEIDGEIVEEADLKMRPLMDKEITDEALEMQGVTKDDLSDYPAQDLQYTAFEALLERLCDIGRGLVGRALFPAPCFGFAFLKCHSVFL